MKFKLNWGWGIAIFFVCFILLLAFNLIFSSLQKNDMVRPDYYQKELEYQKQIDKNARTKKLNEQIKISQSSAALIIQFPKQFSNSDISGNISLYRPSNDKLDKNIKIQTNDEKIIIIDIRDYQKGLWKLKIDWSAGGIDYYNEESINI